ncbi:MAG: GWxTD domain-containing protein [Candidatus Cloacimonadaceae bacterium]|nr:GWxTD domain-containing protein [Candidatus Cloacimonadaceae bacterium]MDP3113693.1 GWxTD domain-containing protein [Candidatus Cloacimonadaceae bacterium]
MSRFLLILILLIVGTLSAQEIIYEKYGSEVDFWIIVPYNGIVFKKGVETVQYQVSVEIKNVRKKQTAKHEETLVIINRDWLRDSALPVRFTTNLPAGKYTARLKLRNVLLGNKQQYDKTFILGEASTEIGQAYYVVKKENMEFMPPTVSLSGLLVESCTLYQKFSLAADSIHVRLNDRTIKYAAPSSPNNISFLDMNGGQVPSSVSISFYEANIHYHMEPFLYNPWFSYNIRYSLKEQIQQLRYITSQNEWQSLRALPDNKHNDGIELYWSMHDPSPGTLRNEARERFYQRVLNADGLFTVHKKLQGWKSDRGRIYIKYGEPDDILSEVHPIGLYPFISWIYYQQNLEFIFADIGGYGQYTLRNKDEEF